MSTNIKELKKLLKKAIRETNGLNQTIVAKRVGISQPYLNEILNDSRSGSFEHFDAIAEAIGVTLQSLLNQIESGSASTSVSVEDEKEKELLQLYRESDVEEQELMLKIAGDLHELSSTKKSSFKAPKK